MNKQFLLTWLILHSVPAFATSAVADDFECPATAETTDNDAPLARPANTPAQTVNDLQAADLLAVLETDTKSAASAHFSAADQKSVSAAAAYLPVVCGPQKLPFSNAQFNDVPYALAREDLAQTPFAAAILEGDRFNEAQRKATTPLQKAALSPSIAAAALKKLYAAVWREIATPADLPPGTTWQNSRNAIAEGTTPRGEAGRLLPPLITIISEYAHSKSIETIFENVVTTEANDWRKLRDNPVALSNEFFVEPNRPVDDPNSFHNKFGQHLDLWPLSRELLLEKYSGWTHFSCGYTLKYPYPFYACLDTVICQSCLKGGRMRIGRFGINTNVFLSWKQPSFYHRSVCDLYADKQRPPYNFSRLISDDKQHLQNTLLRLDILVHEMMDKQNIETDFALFPVEAKNAVLWTEHLNKINILLFTIPKCALIRLSGPKKFQELEKLRGMLQRLLTICTKGDHVNLNYTPLPPPARKS